VIMPQMLKIHSISICEPRMPNICHAKNPTFGNLLSCFLHHNKGNIKSSTYASMWWYKGLL
jgi:hypothetical protein